MSKMNSVEQLLTILEAKDIQIWLEDEELKFSAPKDVFTNSLKEQVRDNKAEIIRHLSNQTLSNQTIQTTPIIENLYDLSPMQAGMLFHSQLTPNSNTYIEHVLFHLYDDTFDPERLVAAMQHVIDRHDSLRATFQTEGVGKAVQVIHRQAQLPVTYEDWRGYTPDEYRTSLSQLIEQDRLTDFDFSQAPLLRFRIIQHRADRTKPSYDLLLTFHHILLDRWSVDLFWSEVLRLYSGLPLPKAIPYQYYIHYLRQQSVDADFWQTYLGGFSTPTALPALYTPARTPTQNRGKSVTFTRKLSEEATQQLIAFMRTEGLTLNVLFQATWALLLARYTRESDVVFGTVMSGRTAPLKGIESILGLLLNTLPFRVQLDTNLTGRALLQQVANTQLELQQREHTSLVDIQQWSDLPAGTGLFEHLLVFQNTPQTVNREHSRGDSRGDSRGNGRDIDNAFNSLELHPGWVEPGETGYPLVAEVALGASKDPLTLAVNYDTEQYDANTVERLLTHWHQLVMGIISHPDQPASSLPMLTDAEYHQITHEWNKTAPEIDGSFGEPQTLHALFEQQVERKPNAIAVIFENERLTYAELNAHANQLAYYLIELGVQTDTLVAVAMERSIDMVVSLLAVLKAGGAYVPIDPTYPEERIRYMLTDSTAPILLTQSHLPLARQIEDADTESSMDQLRHLLAVDRMTSQLVAKPTNNPQTETCIANLAYVMYTSGSTGQPKGVLVEHGGAFNVVMAQAKILPDLTTGSRLLQLGSLGFDAATFELMLALMHGVTLVVPHTDHERMGASLVQLVRRQRITHVMFIPSVFQTLPAADLPDLKVLITAGESCPAHLVNQWGEGRHFFNLYGPAESPIWTTYVALRPGQSVHIGRPIPSRHVYILDDNGLIVPTGVAGDLHIGGVQLARGYLNRPDLTAERFINHPEFGRLYKTGDLCRWLPDGNIEFLGRTDFQVKIRGFRIELGEIENALLAQEGVREVVVLAREENGDKRLVAYIVEELKSGKVEGEDGDSSTLQPFNSSILRDALAQQLPDYMIPSAFVFLDAMPLTPNGKLDRQALPAPAYVDTQNEFVAPRTEIERAVADIWQSVLHVEQVGVNDNFFVLGGHSLLATQVISRVRSQLNLDIPLKSLFEASQLGNFAQVVSEAQESADKRILPVSREKPLPLSFAQQRLWFLDQLEPDSAFYNIPMLLRLTGQLELDALEQSLNYLIARHESLRTTFEAVNGEPIQVIHDPDPFTLTVIPVADEREAQHRGQVEATTPFNLSDGPLMRMQLLQIATEDHLLLLTLHHIISDGWSMGVLIEELTHVYQAFVAGQEPTLPDLPIQYADFAIWQRTYLSGERMEDQLSYWREQLDGAPALLELPTDRPRPPAQSYQGAHYIFTLDAGLTAQLNQLAQAHDATLFMVLLAAFNILLARYSGQEDIVVGSPIANRTRTEIEGLIGFFVNTLVLRTQLADEPSFTELLAQVRQTTLNAYQYQDLPFEQLVDELNLERTFSYSPLFQAMLVLQNAEMGEATLSHLSENLTGTMQPPDFPFSAYDLTLDLMARSHDMGGGLLGVFEYATDLFDETTIARMATHLTSLLKGIVKQAEHSVLQLPLLTDAEYHQLIHEWNHSTYAIDRGFGEPRTIHALFEEQVERTPDAAALVFDERLKDGKVEKLQRDDFSTLGNPLGVFNPSTLTYAELNAGANQLAHYLIKQGVGPGVLVGICVERGFRMVVGLLAVLKAGGAYVPLDPTYPQERLQFMLEDTSPAVLITSELITSEITLISPLISSLPEPHPQCIFLDREWGMISQESTTNPMASVQPSDLAYVMYTSGSTGQPKGVMIEHGSLVNLYRVWQEGHQAHTLQHNYIQMASFAFDIFFWDTVRSLCAGGKLVLCPREWLLDASLLYQLMCQEEIDSADFVPGVLNNLFDYLEETGQNLAFMRVLVVGSERWSIKEYRRGLQLCDPETRFINSYGATELTIDSSYFEEKTVDNFHDEISLIGRPLPTMQLYILAQAYQPVPLGVASELYVGGAGLARGYLNQPELTAERFIEHPEFGRLYKTGDLCRWLPDGNIEYIGRTDLQVKLRGFRIELGEIENALLEEGGIREAVVLVQEDTVRGKRLVAYLAGDVEIETLRQNLARRLPDYMVPSAFVFLDAMPLTLNGTIDHQALPIPDYTDAQSEFVAPRTEMEEQVAAIWQDVLHIGQVGVHDNFFARGGHSLLATQVVSRVRSQLNFDIPLKALFEAPQLGDFAQLIERQSHTSTAIRIQPVTRDQPLPLSFAQRRLWFLDQLEPESAFYNIPDLIRLEGQLDVAALEQSFRYLLTRHESLRTTFETVNGEPIQVIHASQPFTLTVIPVADEAEAQKRGQVEAATPFSLREGPLIRAQLLQIAAEDHLLLLTVHHIISDGWSVRVLVEELAHAYCAYAAGQEPKLPDLSIQYADFAVWQRAYLSGAELERQLSFWREHLRGAPALLELPTGRPRPPVQSYRGAHYLFELSADLTAKLNQLAQEYDATLFMVLLAAYNLLLARYSRQQEIVVGTPIANRNHADIEGLIGFFVNTLVLRTQLEGNPSFTKLLHQVRQTALNTYEHQDLPFEQLVEELNLERTLSYSPLFQAMLVLQNADEGSFDLPGLTATLQPPDFPYAKFDLTLSVMERENGDEAGSLGMFEYATDLFDKATIVRMASHFTMLLEGIVKEPEAPIYQLSMLTKAEYHQITHEWNDTAVDFGEPQTIHALFEEQVERTPDAIALVLEDQKLNYKELNILANQLAHRLIELGVQANTLVAVAMEKSIEMIVSLLAVLKAGGAYVPIDPTYPEERIRYMLADSATPILLTQSHLSSTQFPEYDGVENSSRQSMHVLAVDMMATELAAKSTENPQTQASTNDLAYVIYTSGSTGQPKGVLIEHGGAFNVAMALAEVLPNLTTGSRLLQMASLSFDAATAEIMMALMHGVTLVVAPALHERVGRELAQLLQHQRITHVMLVPSVLQTLPKVDLPDLKVLITAGEACSPALANQWGERRYFFNLYGPTESPIWTTYASLQPEQTVHIGQPIPNRQVYILNDVGRIAPTGVAGELHIGGTQLARGYLNRPELTAECFIDHPEFGRLYKTGDLCRWLPDGNVEFLGRTDFQVKIRGFRIELGEIENALLAQDGVCEAVVLVREVNDDKRLVAYVVMESQSREVVESESHYEALTTRPNDDETKRPNNQTTLRQALAQSLPVYMLPSAFFMLDAMPLMPNGKLDRHALSSPDYADAIPSNQSFVPPATPTEEALAHIWAEVLGIERVGRHDNFFELGGHSLLAIQLVAKISNAFDTNISVKFLFLQPTIAEQAEGLQHHQTYPPSPSHSLTNKQKIDLDSPHIQIENVSLLSLFEQGAIQPVDSVALGYIPGTMLDLFDGDYAQMLSTFVCGKSERKAQTKVSNG
ncbi:MAG: amino acid adenylation domain-containing protein [Chloroflexota bacterium]